MLTPTGEACLMSHHVHLVVIPRRAEALAEALKQVHGRYTSYWNAAHTSAAALKANPAKPHITISPVEHSSVLNYCMALERGGLDRSGRFTPPSVTTGVARASRPLSRECPAPASRGQDAHATAGTETKTPRRC